MDVRFIFRKTWMLITVMLLAAFLVFNMSGAAFAHSRPHAQTFYQQTNLVSDLDNQNAAVTDPNLNNSWGLAASATSPWWTSDNNSGLSTLYNGQGQITPLVVTVPPAAGSPDGTPGTPTGIVFNGTTNFTVSENGVSGTSAFIFDSEDGTISGWSPAVNGTNAILAVDRSTVDEGAVYKGLAIATDTTGTFIYATNFRAGTVEMFDGSFNLVRSFTDPLLAQDCPFPGQCYAPFGIQNIGNQLYVTFALQDQPKHDDVSGFGRGFVDVFDTQGQLVQRLISGGVLDSPWGVALAPADFGQFSNDLLVGNFGDGFVNAYDPNTGNFLGPVRSSDGTPIVIDGLWALEFGNGANAGPTNQLFFTAGPDQQNHGLFGTIQSLS